jgi:hypothetical protein
VKGTASACCARNDGWVLGLDSRGYANKRRWCSWLGSGRRRFLRDGNAARRASGMAGDWLKKSAAWAATFSRTRSAIRSTSYPLARVRISSSAAHSHSMVLSKAATLLDRSRRKLRISVVMLMMPPTQECFVPLGQNHQWNFRTMLAVLRCGFLKERAGSATRRAQRRHVVRASDSARRVVKHERDVGISTRGGLIGVWAR